MKWQDNSFANSSGYVYSNSESNATGGLGKIDHRHLSTCEQKPDGRVDERFSFRNALKVNLEWFGLRLARGINE